MDQESRRSSLQDEIVSQVIGMGGTQLRLSPTHNQPIHNYMSTTSQGPYYGRPAPQQHHDQHKGEKNILEILQSANINVTPLLNNENNHSASLKEQARSGKVKSVEELEADLQNLVLGNKRGEDKSAFNKLLNHLSDSRGGQAHSGPSMSMGPPLDKSKALQEEDLIHNMYMGSHNNHPSLHNGPQHIMPDLRISPTSNSQTPVAGSLMDLIKDLDKPANQQHSISGLLKDQESNSVVDILRSWSEHSTGGEQLGDMLTHMMSHQSQQSLQQQQSSQQSNNSHFQPDRLSANFQNKAKQSNIADLLSQSQTHHQQQQSRQKFMYGHLLPPSPTPEACLGIPLPMAAHLSPRQSPLPHELAAATGRIPSPLVFGQQPPVLSHAPAPIHPAQGAIVGNTSGNTLQVANPGVPRVPSPQELAVHTQSILQNALIKRKLEEQKENFRKRQEAQGSGNYENFCLSAPIRSKSPNTQPTVSAAPAIAKPTTTTTVVPSSSTSSPSKTYTSSVAAFTPTSVMRKMHSEKQDKDGLKPEMNNHGLSPEHKMNHIENNQMNGLSANHNIELMRAVSGQMPRALHGQGSAFNQQQQPQNSYGNQQQINQQQISGYVPNVPRPLTANNGGQGRPIVKGGQGSDHGRDMGAWNPNKIGMAHNKPYMVPNNAGNILRSELDPVTRLVEQQRLLQAQQQQQQQQQSAAPRHSSMAPQGGFPGMGGPRGPPPVIPAHQQNLLRPNMNSANLNIPLLRSMVQAQANFGHPNIRAPGASLNQLSQLAALQQQQQQAHQQAAAQQRKALDPNRQIRNFPPLAIQQLLLNAQSQAAAAAVASAPGIMNNNISLAAAGRNPDNAFAGGIKQQGLLPPNQAMNRHSPVNLARWFGNDVLKQKMPDMPPVPLQNALSVEELERQHATTVHN